MAKAGYRAGTADAVPLLVSQQAAAAAQGQQVQARLGQALGLVALYTALGGGWKIQD